MQIQYIEAGIKMMKILCIPIRMKPSHPVCYFPVNMYTVHTYIYSNIPVSEQPS